MKQYRTNRSGIRWAGVALAAVILTAVSVTACTSSKSTSADSPPKSPTPTTTSTVTKPGPPTVWQKTLAKVKPDGSVDVSTALTAFALAIGPVPGVTPPAGPRDNITSGTIAVRWVLAHWAELTPAQQAAVLSSLGESKPTGTHSIIGLNKDAAPSNKPNIPCLTKDSAKAERYRGAFDAMVDEMESHLWPLRVRDHVFFAENTKQLEGKLTDAYTYGCVGSNSQVDQISGCTIHFNPQGSSDNVSVNLIHELTHCFIMSRFGDAAEARMPDWFAEGAPEWIGVTLASGDPIDEGWWPLYLDSAANGVPLSQLTYDGLGFFVHLVESGSDGWAAIRAIAPELAANPSTARGWAAANPNEQFLDTWGSGLVQGRYDGAAWKISSPNLAQYQPPIGVKDLPNDGSPQVGSSAFAPKTVELNVSAEVVEVHPGGSASGRLSLGNGKDVTLAATAGQTYCTLGSDKCKCPEDSEKADTTFTPMEKGTEYVGVTGGSAAASVTLDGQSLEDFCGDKKGSLVGTWRATSGATIANAGTGSVKTIGGAGTTMTIAKTGAMSVTYNGMAPASYDVTDKSGPGMHGKATVTGGDTATLDLKAKGAWNPQGLHIGTNVVANITSPGAAQYHGPEGMAQFFGPIYAGTWKITGKTLTVVWQGNNGGFHQQTTWVFTRVK